MSTAHELGPAPTRVTVDVDLVRRLVAGQFPQWSHLPVRPVDDGGWDNWTFHLGPTMSVRLPAAAEYALAVDKEQFWLPRLGRQLPLPISTPVGRGEPQDGYPFPWSVLRWLEGDPVTPSSVVDGTVDPLPFALDLADFLAALQRIDPTDGPTPGAHNWFRGGSLLTYDGGTRTALEALEGRLDTDLAGAVWASALDARWDAVPVWFHGDVATGNLLARDGRLAAVIDFGTCGVGDPACDLAGAWTLLDTLGRNAFRSRLAVDDGTWARGRGWALWKGLITCTEPADADAAATARRTLEAIFEEYETDGVR